MDDRAVTEHQAAEHQAAEHQAAERDRVERVLDETQQAVQYQADQMAWLTMLIKPDPQGAELANGGPRLLSRGRYSMYKPPDGGLHLAFRPEHADEDQHIVIPAWVIRAAVGAASSGGHGPVAMLRAMFGRR